MTAREARSASQETGKGAVLTKAVVRAADFLGLTNKALAEILGQSESTVSRMVAGRYVLKEDSKSFELGVLFVRLVRSLDAIVGGDQDTIRGWIRGRNTVLNATPLEKMQTIAGLTEVLSYLDARRARI